MVRDEVETHIVEYTLLGLTKTSIRDQMNLYLVHKAFDNDFVDIVPLILARVFQLNIIIWYTAMSGLVNEYTMYPREELTSSIVLQRRGDHYNGIVTAPTVKLCAEPTANCTAKPCDVITHDINLPFPWSLDPLPPVTPVLLPHLIDTPPVLNEKDPVTIHAEPQGNMIMRGRSTTKLTHGDLCKSEIQLHDR